MNVIEELERTDPAAAEIARRELQRQNDVLEMIASENHVSAAVRAAAGTVLTNKYAEGYPFRRRKDGSIDWSVNGRYYGGCEHVDEAEKLAIERAKQLFGAEHVNVQPHSGSQANMSVYFAACQVGDTVLSMSLDHGGHLTHGHKVNFSGRLYNIVPYGVDAKSERLDFEQIARLAREHKPKLIMCGASAYPRDIPFEKFAEIADEVGATLCADIAHVAGLVATRLHSDPIPYCQFVTTTTHKTLRGPRAGMIMCKAEWGKKIDSSVFPGTQGGPLCHIILAKAVALGEALRPEFADYCRQIIVNAKTLAEELMGLGYRLVSGGTDNHLMLLDLRSKSEALTGKIAETWLQQAGIVVNKNMIPFDPRPPVHASGIRIGTPALTTRGLGAEHMRTIAGWIDQVLSSEGDEKKINAVREQTRELCRQFPLPH